jgi:hypothetical protein
MYHSLQEKYRNGTICLSDEINGGCWNYISFKHSHWKDIIKITQDKTFHPPEWLLGKAIRDGNIDAVTWCLNDLHAVLDPHQYLRDLSDIGYNVVKYLFDQGLLKLNSYLFDDRLCHFVSNEDEAIRIAELLLDNNCIYTEWCLSFCLTHRKYKLYSYLRSRGIEWNKDRKSKTL